ncbi:MAG: hypothetical protein WBH52_11625 [Pseudomonas aeruginosa]
MSNQALNAAAKTASKKAESKPQGANAEKANAAADLQGANDTGAQGANAGNAGVTDDDENDDDNAPAADGTQKVYVLTGAGLPANLAPFTRFSAARKVLKAAIDAGHAVTMETKRAKVTKQVSVTLA